MAFQSSVLLLLVSLFYENQDKLCQIGSYDSNTDFNWLLIDSNFISLQHA